MADPEKPKVKRARRGGQRRKVQTVSEAAEPARATPAAEETPAAPAGRDSGGGLSDWTVSQSDITVFLRELIMMLEAGTPLLRSLQTLADRTRGSGTRALVQDIAGYVEQGNPLWQAFNRHPRHFSQVFVNMVKAAEASGTLTIILERLVSYREKRAMLVKRVRAAMIYPVVLLLVCVGVLLLISRFVVPEFKNLYDQVDMDLPAFTQGFIAVSEFISSAAFLGTVVVVLVVLWLVYTFAIMRHPLWRARADRVKLSLPVVGPILKRYSVAEFTRLMGLMLRSGLSMMVTLDLVRSSVGNRALARVIQQVRDSVERGEGLEEPLRQNEGVVPAVVTDMLVTGEESGQLDRVSEHVADQYEEEVEIAVNGLGETLQPLVTVIIGVFVALLFVALFMPMVNMIQQLNQQGL